jgi:hypothetical protein
MQMSEGPEVTEKKGMSPLRMASIQLLELIVRM